MNQGTGNTVSSYSQNASGTIPQTPARVGQIEERIAGINREVDHLHDLLKALEDRLTPAIPQIPKSDEKGGPRPVGPTLAPLAARLEDGLTGIQAAQYRVRALLDTLEL